MTENETPLEGQSLHERAEAILAPVLTAQGRMPRSYSSDEYLLACEQAGNELTADEAEEFPTEEMRQEAALLASRDTQPSLESVRTMLATKRHLREMGFDAQPGKPLPDNVDAAALVAAGSKVEQEREAAIISLAERGAPDSKIAEMLGTTEREVLSVRNRKSSR